MIKLPAGVVVFFYVASGNEQYVLIGLGRSWPNPTSTTPVVVSSPAEPLTIHHSSRQPRAKP